MFWELWHYAMNPATELARAYRFPQELISMWGRAKRCEAAWRPHAMRVRTVLLETLNTCAQRRKAVVLGSGILTDVPLEALAATFDEVVLVDMLHLRPVKRAVRRYPNVRLELVDVSGLLEPLDREIRRFEREGGPLTVPEARPAAFLDDPTVDFVVSLNLLSQLPILPLIRLEQLRDGAGKALFTVEQIRAIGRRMVRDHLEYLLRFDARVCLITDVEQLVLNQQKRLVSSSGVFYGAPVNVEGESWIWEIAPLPEACPIEHIHHRMVAVPDLHHLKERLLEGTI